MRCESVTASSHLDLHSSKTMRWYVPTNDLNVSKTSRVRYYTHALYLSHSLTILSLYICTEQITNIESEIAYKLEWTRSG